MNPRKRGSLLNFKAYTAFVYLTWPDIDLKNTAIKINKAYAALPDMGTCAKNHQSKNPLN